MNINKHNPQSVRAIKAIAAREEIENLIFVLKQTVSEIEEDLEVARHNVNIALKWSPIFGQ